MVYNYLSLCNRVLKAFNEVQLTDATFITAAGFHAEVKDAINMAILDVFTEEDAEWPWTHTTIIKDTVTGTQQYDMDTSVEKIDWDSFRVQRPKVSVTSITQTSGTATVTTDTAHYLVVGDKVYISGANETGYNNYFVVLSAPSTTTYTIAVNSALDSPATGTIVSYPPFSEEYLVKINIDVYRKTWLETDRNTIDPASFGKPCTVVRMQDDTFLIRPKPNRVYPIAYEGFDIPDPLEACDDVPVIPEKYQQLIVDRALHYAYMFRDNIEQAGLADKRWRDAVNRIRRIKIEQPSYMSFE
jgi:hypothetical protein